VTTGPSILFQLHDTGRIYVPGDEAPGGDLRLSLEIKSIREFGFITSVSIIQGDLASRTETSHVIGVRDLEFQHHGPLPFGGRAGRGYIRIACASEHGLALSNPIWIAKGDRDPRAMRRASPPSL
jgi:hypothetical protein